MARQSTSDLPILFWLSPLLSDRFVLSSFHSFLSNCRFPTSLPVQPLQPGRWLCIRTWGRALRSLFRYCRFTASAVTSEVSLEPLTCLTRLSHPLRHPFRKEVIQPHLPVRLPCYDFVPVIRPTLGSSSLAVKSPTSGVPNSHDVTGGVYKARERIQRSIADLRLLATPASCRRVAACNLNYERL